MNGLSCGEESMTICSAVLIEYDEPVTDRQPDRQTESKTCISMANARKNVMKIIYQTEVQWLLCTHANDSHVSKAMSGDSAILCMSVGTIKPKRLKLKSPNLPLTSPTNEQ